MKTTPATSNGPRLVHAAENTDDVKILALTPHNYRPDAVRRAARMERDPFGGYKIEIILHDQAGVIFAIERRTATLTVNRAHYNHKCSELTLKTKLVLLPEEQAAMMANLEQCAAIGLLLPNFPKL
jgi:hypothetical protein